MRRQTQTSKRGSDYVVPFKVSQEFIEKVFTLKETAMPEYLDGMETGLANAERYCWAITKDFTQTVIFNQTIQTAEKMRRILSKMRTLDAELSELLGVIAPERDCTTFYHKEDKDNI